MICRSQRRRRSAPGRHPQCRAADCRPHRAPRPRSCAPRYAAHRRTAIPTAPRHPAGPGPCANPRRKSPPFRRDRRAERRCGPQRPTPLPRPARRNRTPNIALQRAAPARQSHAGLPSRPGLHCRSRSTSESCVTIRLATSCVRFSSARSSAAIVAYSLDTTSIPASAPEVRSSRISPLTISTSW